MTPIDLTDSNQLLIHHFLPHCEGTQISACTEAFKKTFGSKEIEAISLVTGGRGTSKILKIRVESHDYVYRITDNSRPHFFIDCASEIERMSSAATSLLTPSLYYADSETGILIMDYVQNIPLMTELLQNQGQCKHLYPQFARKLKVLHTGPNFSEYTNIFTDIMQTANATKPACMPPLAHRVISSLANIERALQPHRTNVPSHKELNSNNVLFDGQEILFIDWESSANADQFVDLAIVSNFFIFDPSLEDLFLEHYFSTPPTDEQRAQLLLMKVACLAFYGFKSMRRVTGPGKQDLSLEQIDFSTLPNYQTLLKTYFNGCSKTLTFDDFKTMTYVYLREAANYIESQSFDKAIALLNGIKK